MVKLKDLQWPASRALYKAQGGSSWMHETAEERNSRVSVLLIKSFSHGISYFLKWQVPVINFKFILWIYWNRGDRLISEMNVLFAASQGFPFRHSLNVHEFLDDRSAGKLPLLNTSCIIYWLYAMETVKNEYKEQSERSSLTTRAQRLPAHR